MYWGGFTILVIKMIYSDIRLLSVHPLILIEIKYSKSSPKRGLFEIDPYRINLERVPTLNSSSNSIMFDFYMTIL
jgi:hypothetical protein